MVPHQPQGSVVRRENLYSCYKMPGAYKVIVKAPEIAGQPQVYS